MCGCSDCQEGRFHGFSLTGSVDVAWAARDYVAAKDGGAPAEAEYQALKAALAAAGR